MARSAPSSRVRVGVRGGARSSARMPFRDRAPSLPSTGHRRSGGRLQRTAVAVAVGVARCRHRRCGSGGRVGLPRTEERAARPRSERGGVPCAPWSLPSPPRHEMLGRRSGELRGGGGLADWLRSALRNGSREIRSYASGSPADHGQQRRRLALDPGAGEQERRERHPHRRNEDGGDSRRQMSERLHVRVFGSGGRPLRANAASPNIARNPPLLHHSCRILHAPHRAPGRRV